MDPLTTLDLSHKCLQDVPNNVFSHERTLEDLYLDANQIRDLPRALFHCEGLRGLYLSDNELQSIPSAVSSLTRLEVLNISKNNILQIPDTIKSCKCLTVVDASINPLGPRLPDGFTQLINLQELYLNDAFLEFLPANFGRLSRLQIVELRENHLKALPKSMSRLVDLRRLDIGQNDFLEFPEVITSLHKLSELWCDCNRIISIPNTIGDLKENSGVTAITIGDLKELTYLDASYNKIEDIAAEMGDCLQLTDLTFTSNNLIELPEKLPESIGNLVNLKILRLDVNEIKYLTSAIGSLSSLEELVFNENEVESLPTNIGLLRNLQTLIGDCNKLTDLPVSIGSCMNLRILSLAENQLKVIPDELGRLSALKVLNLNSNFLTYLPLSLTKITNLQALWLNENQTKPLIKLQSDIDRESGQKVLTCFLLPQMSDHSRNSPKSLVSPNDSNNDNNLVADRQMIKFSNDPSDLNGIDDDLDVRITTKLIRAPTPYPKELKAHARHARNLALKQKDINNTVTSTSQKSDNDMIVATNESEPISPESDQMSSHSQVKEAKVSKSPSNIRHIPNSEPPKRPTTLPISSAFNVPNVEKSPKRSYKVAVNSSLSLKSPIERKLKSKSIFSKEDNERGYKSDVELYSTQKLSNNTTIGYSSDCESKRMDRLKEVVPKERDLESALNKKPLETDLYSKCNSESDCCLHTINQSIGANSSDKSNDEIEISDTLVKQISTHNLVTNSHTNQNSSQKTSIFDSITVNAIDVNSNSSVGSLYPSTGSERPVSVCSGHSPYSSTGSTASDHPNGNPSQCSLSRTQLKPTEATNQTPALPPKPLNYIPSRLDIGLTAPVVANSRLRQPQTASSQFIIHKFSHDSYTQSKPSIGHNLNPHSVLTTNEWNLNGIDFIDDSNESNGSNGSHNCNLLNSVNNNLNRPNRIFTTSTAHVFPVIIVKNPGLGFSIECGLPSKKANDSSGVFVSCVEPAGSASTALKVGDRILQIDGIDLQNVTKDKANHIFESTGDTISLMVSRDKS
ncbi:unnamed protein product [Oppiella nova]|uniref:PDZ domain-containing protein n=1 Tax=Oppiella nova TaxID=334625 RepID=A0A7R9LAI7_9ACAR|nr:unnamed protein product [Oppiella nova]CAG2161612.1 unnamed protein product [Oppiella nova]